MEQISLLYQNSESGFVLSIVKDDDVIVFTEPSDETERIITGLKNILQ